MKCWGWSAWGALGDGTSGTQRATPVDVVGLYAPPPPPPPPSANATVALDDDDRAAGLAGHPRGTGDDNNQRAVHLVNDEGAR